MSLVARHLEEHGIPTVVFATARDIVEHCGVPRMVFVDFPLGSPCGEPEDAAMQRQVVEMGLRLLETAAGPRTTREAGLRWSKGEKWKELIFTQEQPFLSGQAHEQWMARKALYRKLKTEGEV